MKRICLFAAYNKNGIVQDYVVYYLKCLSVYADIYYMADNPTSESELMKIKPYIKESYCCHHGRN